MFYNHIVRLSVRLSVRSRLEKPAITLKQLYFNTFWHIDRYRQDLANTFAKWHFFLTKATPKQKCDKFCIHINIDNIQTKELSNLLFLDRGNAEAKIWQQNTNNSWKLRNISIIVAHRLPPTRSSQWACQITIFTDRDNAEGKKKKKNENSHRSLIVWSILIKSCIHIDTDKILLKQLPKAQGYEEAQASKRRVVYLSDSNCFHSFHHTGPKLCTI